MIADQNRGGIWATLALYGAWLVTSLGVIIDVLYVREAVSTLLTVLDVTHMQNYRKSGNLGIDFNFAYAMTFYDEAILFILFLAAVAFVVAIEYYYRRGRPKGLLFKRIGIVFGIEVAVVVVSIIFQQLI
jgi:hypothetical protein